MYVLFAPLDTINFAYRYKNDFITILFVCIDKVQVNSKLTSEKMPFLKVNKPLSDNVEKNPMGIVKIMNASLLVHYKVCYPALICLNIINPFAIHLNIRIQIPVNTFKILFPFNLFQIF